jgi:PAS domain S-box-containing protein
MNTPRRLPNDAISQFDEWAAAVFDQSSLGMIRISPDLRVVACNRTAAEIHGLSTLEGRSIAELLADQKDIEIMQRQAEQRREGLSTEYEVELLHRPDQRRVPVKVSGMPIISSTGDVVGSLAIIRSLELERRVEAFEEAIHSTKEATGIFKAVNRQVESFLNFDFSSFSIYSKNGKHSRMLLSYDPERQVESHKRWYPLCGALADWTQRHEVQVIDLTEFVRQFPEFQNDSTVKRFISSGFVKSLRVPVVRGGRVVAAFSCASRNRDTFTDDQLAIVKALPIAKAFLMALHFLENDELSFRFDLIRDMFICRTPEQIAEAATKKLADQYGWESVEIYTIEEASRKIRLVSQSAVSPEFAIEEGYSQPIEKGILGYVCKTDQDVLIDDVTRDPQFKDLYVPLRRATLSELCMPIRVNGRISGVLNVEDKHENAFTEEEQEKLRSLLDEIGALFGAVWDKALIASAFELTPALVLIADTAHNVIQHNAAAIARLGFSAEELTGSPIGNYFEQPEIAERVFQTSLAGIETGLRCKDGSILPVLLGSRELEGFGAWVISARDLTNQKRIAELESLRRMYREIAAQTKTPLSLACSWILRLQRKAEESQDETSSILQKVLTQLKKVDITYERLALYSQSSGAAVSKEILLNAGDLLKRTLDNFPQELLSIRGLDATNLYVRGDPFEIEFAVESTISYLQRFLPAHERVEVRLSSAAGRLLIHIQGFFPPEPTGSAGGEPPETVCQTIHEMALGADIIGDFMQRHGGSFRQETMTNNIVRFQLDFPLEHVEA